VPKVDAYVATFFGVLSTAVTPMPEETALLAAGWLAHRSGARLVAVIACACAAIILGDVGTFLLGRGVFRRVGQRIGRWFPGQGRVWADTKVARHGWRAILLARFLIGMRGLLYFALGASRYPFRRFLALDLVVAVAEVSLVVGVGYGLGAGKHARARIERIDVFAIAVVVASLIVPWLIQRLWRRHAIADQPDR
jgi:membrane-associated protein